MGKGKKISNEAKLYPYRRQGETSALSDPPLNQESTHKEPKYDNSLHRKPPSSPKPVFYFPFKSTHNGWIYTGYLYPQISDLSLNYPKTKPKKEKFIRNLNKSKSALCKKKQKNSQKFGKPTEFVIFASIFGLIPHNNLF